MSDMYPNYVITLPIPTAILEAGIIGTYAVKAINERRAVEKAVDEFIEELHRHGMQADAAEMKGQFVAGRTYTVLRSPPPSGRGTRAPG